MNYIYLGSTLVNVTALSINNVLYVNLFEKIDCDSIKNIAQSNLVISNYYSDNNIISNNHNFFERIPKDIAQLYQCMLKLCFIISLLNFSFPPLDCFKSSHYSFLFSVAYIFANNITKSGSFFRLKLALMLSMISQKEEPKVSAI